MGTFERAFAIVVNVEANLSLDPHDAGNWTGGKIGVGLLNGTKFGISAAAYPNVDIATLTLGTAQAIYRTDYWNPVAGDSLPWPFALLVFDCAVNQGQGIAQRMMQAALEVVVDGAIGPQTIAAAQASTIDHWAAFMTLRRHRYELSPAYPRYGDGWTNRMFKVCLLQAQGA